MANVTMPSGWSTIQNPFMHVKSAEVESIEYGYICTCHMNVSLGSGGSFHLE